MELKTLKINEIKPYKNNPRVNDKAVHDVAESIKQCTYVAPIIVDENNVILAGHTRYKALKQLGRTEAECIIKGGLTDEQKRKYRILDNKTNESAEWDFDLLKDEIADLDFFDFDFDFDLDFEIAEETAREAEEKHIQAQEETQRKVENILNLGKGQFDGENDLDIPELEPVYELPEIKEWIGFNYVLSDKNPEGKAVHFFIDDYQFERVWNEPEKYLDKLRQYVCIATPDFSPYGDMPLIAQIWNHYRKHWVGAWFQEHGLTVIPTIRASTDRRFLNYYLDGEPHNGIVLISSMWTNTDDEKAIFKEEYETMKEKLNPCRTFVYGKPTETTKYDDVTYISSFSESRWVNNG